MIIPKGLYTVLLYTKRLDGHDHDRPWESDR